MKLLKLLLLASSTSLCLLVAYLFYPEAISNALSDPENASASDIAIAFEAASIGFTLGLLLLLKIGTLIGNREFQREIRSDKVELKVVFISLSGICLAASGFMLLDQGSRSGWIHLMLVLGTLVYAAVRWRSGRKAVSDA